jgi:Fur family ferric uptake transcriptional regulator
MSTPRHEPEAIWTQLRRAGLRVTPLRRRLVRLFATSERWYSPQELSAAAEKAGLRPGRATVYRLIDALTAAGLCKSYPQPNRLTRYVFCTPEHHHHMICLDCGKVTDFATCKVKAPDATFTVKDHAVDFFGSCAVCRSGSGERGRRIRG